MRIFVYEWTCCAGRGPASMQREGLAMLRAILQDFRRAGIHTVTLVHEGEREQLPGTVLAWREFAQEQVQFQALAADAGATLVIAPETGNVLLDRARWVEAAGGTLLGPTLEAIELTTDKLRCEEMWRRHGVPTPAVWGSEDGIEYPTVLKPRDGAGSQATFLVRNKAELLKCIRQAKDECKTTEFLVQQFVEGQAASVAFLYGVGGAVALPPATQLLSDDGRFRYLGGDVPLPQPLAERAVALGRRALDVVPGLRGYVGVDLVLGDPADGSGDFAIEINPRLTTSYIGLRQLTNDNLALAMLRAAQGKEFGELRWREDVVHF